MTEPLLALVNVKIFETDEFTFYLNGGFLQWENKQTGEKSFPQDVSIVREWVAAGSPTAKKLLAILREWDAFAEDET